MWLMHRRGEWLQEGSVLVWWVGDRINEGAYNRGKRRRRVFIPVVARQVNRPPPPHPLPIYTYRNHDGCIYAYYPVCGSFWSHSTSELMGGILSPFLVVLVCRTRWGPDLLLQQEEQQSLYSVLFMKQSFYVFRLSLTPPCLRSCSQPAPFRFTASDLLWQLSSDTVHSRSAFPVATGVGLYLCERVCWESVESKRKRKKREREREREQKMG